MIRRARIDEVLELAIIVDDASVSPNQKEVSWAILQQMLPLLMKQPLSIEVWGKLLKASPLPGSVVGEFVETVQQDQQKQQAEQASGRRSCSSKPTWRPARSRCGSRRR